jgi:hypothetical protein
MRPGRWVMAGHPSARRAFESTRFSRAIARGRHQPFAPTQGVLASNFRYVDSAVALRPTAGQRTLDPLMVVRIHQGQLVLGIPVIICCDKLVLSY